MRHYHDHHELLDNQKSVGCTYGQPTKKKKHIGENLNEFLQQNSVHGTIISDELIK